MKVICISGKAGHGKDTFASYLEKELTTRGQRVLVTHYADLLKYICKAFFGWDGKKDTYGRWLLQTVGTDTIRAQNPDYWVSFIASILKLFPQDWDYVLIPDTRFPNEIDIMKEQGFEVYHIRVERNGATGGLTPEQLAHPSETALDEARADFRVYNNGTIADLSNTAEFVAKELLGTVA